MLSTVCSSLGVGPDNSILTWKFGTSRCKKKSEFPKIKNGAVKSTYLKKKLAKHRGNKFFNPIFFEWIHFFFKCKAIH